MEHIVQLGINIDDEAIRKAIENEGRKQIVNDIKKDLSRSFFKVKYYGNAPDPDAGFTEHTEKIIMDFLNENKQDIIEQAAKLFAEKMVRTKAGKEVIEQAKKINS